MRADRRGAALIFVLYLLVVLGALAAEVGRAARLEAGIVESVRARAIARYAAESGVEAAVARVGRLLEAAPTAAGRAALFRGLPSQLASLSDVALGDARFGVAIADLSARIDLNHSDSESVVGLLRQFTSEQEATLIAVSVRARPLERVGELAFLPGVTDALALAIAPYVTVWSDGIININSAPEPVLAALPGIGPAGARSIITRRNAGELFTPASPTARSGGARITVVPAPQTALVVTVPTHLLVIARGWSEHSPLTHEIQAVYTIAGAHLELQMRQERDL